MNVFGSGVGFETKELHKIMNVKVTQRSERASRERGVSTDTSELQGMGSQDRYSDTKAPKPRPRREGAARFQAQNADPSSLAEPLSGT